MKRNILSVLTIILGIGAVPAAAQAQGYCREYSQRIQIDGRWQDGYGTACLQPDGSWQAVTVPQAAPIYVQPQPVRYYEPVRYPVYTSGPSLSLTFNDYDRHRPDWKHHRRYHDNPWKFSYGHRDHGYGHGHGHGHGKGHGGHGKGHHGHRGHDD